MIQETLHTCTYGRRPRGVGMTAWSPRRGVAGCNKVLLMDIIIAVKQCFYIREDLEHLRQGRLVGEKGAPCWFENLNEREDAKANAQRLRAEGERASAASQTRAGGKARARGQGEDGAIAVYLSAPSTSKSSAVNA
jgi:hypothetical protein